VRRTGSVFFVLAIVGGAIVFLLARGVFAGNSPAGEPKSYRVDVVFDTAKGVIPGQVAKVAGARVGRIEKVSLTPGYKARIELSIDGRFAPFRADASCSIQPEGLISERFIQCDPGTQSAPPLRAHGDEPPTVPVSHTSVPVGLTDLFSILDAPAEQRLRLLLSEFGAGVSGEGSDLNGILLRAAPALQDVRKVLKTLRAQRAALSDAVTSTDRAVAAMVGRRERLRGFIGSSSRFLARTATRQRELSDAVRRLPPLLDAAQPALERLHTAARATTPVLADLRSAAPPLDKVLTGLPSFSSAGTRALGRLDVAAGAGLTAIRRSEPVVRLLETFAAAGLPTGESLARTLVDLRDSGTLDGALNFVYSGGATLALYDDISHIGATRLTSNGCVPNLPSAANPAACPSDQATIPPPPGTKQRTEHKHHAPSAPQLPSTPHVPAPHVPTPKLPALPPLPKVPPVKVPGLPPVPQTPPPPDDSGAKQVLDWLLG
jgi:virulence factor Mce-like protein